MTRLSCCPCGLIVAHVMWCIYCAWLLLAAHHCGSGSVALHVVFVHHVTHLTTQKKTTLLSSHFKAVCVHASSKVVERLDTTLTDNIMAVVGTLTSEDLYFQKGLASSEDTATSLSASTLVAVITAKVLELVTH